ncbi:cyclic nucleotide-binding-like protein [Gongronella butleri]|nr:cyclic nucleotide-binding-like protein [Gongronella butleri]
MSREQEIHPFAIPADTRPAFDKDQYQHLVNELNAQVQQKQPDDILQFCSSFFLSKLQDERSQARGGASTFSFAPAPNTHQDEAMDEEEEERDQVGDLHTLPMASLAGRGRRTSVSAESLQPTHAKDFVKTVIPKTDAQRERIREAISHNFLFKHLDEEQYTDVVNAMAEKVIPKDYKVIEQGAVGDYFYIVEEGTLDCLINNEKVTQYTAGGSFGELALMYNAPRAATIISTSECVLWALDRVSFRMILLENTSRKRRMYDQFLSEVPLLKSLEPYERHKIADALEPLQFTDGQVVIKEGDVGDNFYLIEQGSALCYKTAADGSQSVVNRLEKGGYFGELALLNDQPRAATVVAQGKLKCVTLSKPAFQRLLGSVVDVLKRNTTNYHAVMKEANQ